MLNLAVVYTAGGSIDEITGVYKRDAYLIASIKDSYGDLTTGVKLSVIVNGKTYTKTSDEKGQIKISVSNLAPKTYTAKIQFNGNENYLKSSATVKITVKKASVKITAKKKTFRYKVKTKKYTISLKDNDKS